MLYDDLLQINLMFMLNVELIIFILGKNIWKKNYL